MLRLSARRCATQYGSISRWRAENGCAARGQGLEVLEGDLESGAVCGRAKSLFGAEIRDAESQTAGHSRPARGCAKYAMNAKPERNRVELDALKHLQAKTAAELDALLPAILDKSFNFPTHMEQVSPGNAIFMFAKSIGIIGIGIAMDGCKKLKPNDRGRIRKGNTPEWRVPVKWLKWDEARAFEWETPLRSTFTNVTGSKYEKFREDVRKRFLCDT
jgi:hypothetical protein